MSGAESEPTKSVTLAPSQAKLYRALSQSLANSGGSAIQKRFTACVAANPKKFSSCSSTAVDAAAAAGIAVPANLRQAGKPHLSEADETGNKNNSNNTQNSTPAAPLPIQLPSDYKP
ncbi:MAG: hypothetical protein ABI216_07420 [Devosia sp.]